MIDAWNITNYNRTDAELEEFILFAVAVAGKRADTTAEALDRFLEAEYAKSPFQQIRIMLANWMLDSRIRTARLGQWKKLKKAFTQLSGYVNVRDLLSMERLESIHGIGPKTARFILLHSVPDIEVACLDTHILKFLRSKGYDAPKTTPSSKKRYRELELAFVREARRAGKGLAEFDLEIWKMYAVGKSPVIKTPT